MAAYDEREYPLLAEFDKLANHLEVEDMPEIDVNSILCTLKNIILILPMKKALRFIAELY